MPPWLTTTLLVAAGGAVGANARYWLGRVVPHAHPFPWATFAVNVAGSAVLGAVAAVCLHHPDPARRSWYALLGTGLCGGFTTFSTFSLETLTLLRDGRPGLAAVYVGGSVAAGLAGVWCGLRAFDGRT